jgi:hypothetical protein
MENLLPPLVPLVCPIRRVADGGKTGEEAQGQNLRRRLPVLRNVDCRLLVKENFMPEGLKLKVSSTELREHLAARSRHHSQRAVDKQLEFPKLREALERIKSALADTPIISEGGQSWLNELNGGAMVSNKAAFSYQLDEKQVIASLERDIKNHDNQFRMFDFFSKHLYGEDYTFTESELRNLEFIK